MKRFLAWALGSLIACNGNAEDGRVQIFTEPEDTIPDGLEPGTGGENITDGWAVTYARFLVTIGNFRAARSDADNTLSEPAIFVLDLKNGPAGGYVVASFDEVSAVRWDRFGFDLPNARGGAQTLGPTAQADVDFMVHHGYSIYFEGTIDKPDGQSCLPTDPMDCVPATTIAFAWGLKAGTAFDDCATEDGVAGFAVPSGGSVQVKPTIHGDHWFFTNITAGAEVTERSAQYIADSDLDRNGETTLGELGMVQAANVFPSPPYSLGGAGTINTALDYVIAQARTLGDYQGDGECPTRATLP